MMTAGHCTEEGGVSNMRTWVKFSENISFGTGCHGDLACLVSYDFNQFPATYDVGVVKLATPLSMPMYGELPSLGFLETIRAAAENHFTVVGNGMQGYIPAFPPTPALSCRWSRGASRRASASCPERTAWCPCAADSRQRFFPSPAEPISVRCLNSSPAPVMTWCMGFARQ